MHQKMRWLQGLRPRPWWGSLLCPPPPPPPPRTPLAGQPAPSLGLSPASVPYHTYMYHPGFAAGQLSPLNTCFAPPPPPPPPTQHKTWLRAWALGGEAPPLKTHSPVLRLACHKLIGPLFKARNTVTQLQYRPNNYLTM